MHFVILNVRSGQERGNEQAEAGDEIIETWRERWVRLAREKAGAEDSNTQRQPDKSPPSPDTRSGQGLPPKRASVAVESTSAASIEAMQRAVTLQAQVSPTVPEWYAIELKLQENSQIFSWLFLSGQYVAENEELLQKSGICRVVNCTRLLPNSFPDMETNNPSWYNVFFGRPFHILVSSVLCTGLAETLHFPSCSHVFICIDAITKTNTTYP